MNFNMNSILNTYIKNNFHFIQLEKHKHLFKFNIYYLEKNLLYIQIINLNKIPWSEDLIIRLYDIKNEELYEDLSIGGSRYEIKEIELYTNIDLIKYEYISKKNIPNTILQIKEVETFEINKMYQFFYFLYKNNQYNYQNVNINDLNNQIENNYPTLYKYLKNILNIKNKNFLIILLYLNLNGGIFISEYVKNINSIDSLNIDENAYLIENNYIYLLFTKIKFLNIELLENDLKQHKRIEFTKYLNDFKILNINEFQIDENVNIDKNTNTGYTHYFEFDELDIYIFSKKNLDYHIEKLQNKYYNLNLNKNKIETDLIIDIFLKKDNKKIKWIDSMIKFKNENNYIFKI